MFNTTGGIITLDLTKWNTDNLTSAANMFSYMANLKSLDISTWNTSKFNSSSKDMIIWDQNLTDFNSPTFYIDLSFAGDTALSIDSLMSIINGLAPTTSARTLTLSTASKNKLTDEQIAIATNKGWTIA